jgi:hypothetical protein
MECNTAYFPQFLELIGHPVVWKRHIKRTKKERKVTVYLRKQSV